MAFDAESEAQRVAACDGTVLTDPVGVLDLAQVGAGLTGYRRHEEIGGFLRVVPGHSILRPRAAPALDDT
jgi:hypothetical protein